MTVFHENQIHAAEQIIHAFPEHRFSVLLAQMQSGKTGTYLCVALQMVRLGLVERVVIICGSSDTSLRSQTKKDLAVAMKGYGREVNHSGDVDGMDRLLEVDIDVFFSQDLADIGEIGTKTLIIHDESHMAQSKNNIPYKLFYQQNNLTDALMGDSTLLNEKDNFILGVSATPFSEIVANKKVSCDDWTAEEKSFIGGINLDAKNFYFMEPGNGYIGVTELTTSNAIKFESDEIKSASCGHIVDVLRAGAEKYENRFCVVRTHRAEKDQDTVQTIATALGYDYKSVFGGEKTDLKFMEEQPYKKTVVHICGRFRMGQVVPKKFIAMVYEQSKNPNADTILQGLLGRMCGYESSGAHTSVDIFVSPKAEALIQKYEKAWSTGEMDVLSSVTKAMNLGGTRRRNGGTIVTIGQGDDAERYIATVPIEFSCRHLERDHGEVEVKKFRQITASDLVNMFEDHPELIADNPDKDEILKTLKATALHHHLAFRTQAAKAKSEKYYAQLTNAVGTKGRANITAYAKDAVRKKKTSTEFERAPLSIYGSCANADNTSGKCYLMGYVRHDPAIHPQESVELAAVDPKCNYIPGIVTMEDDSVLDNVNGGQFITFSLETADDPNLLREALSASIMRTNPGHDTFIPSASRSINSLYDKAICGYEGIRLERSIYTPETIQDIIDSLEREHSVKLTLKKSRGRQPKDYHKYASISW